MSNKAVWSRRGQRAAKRVEQAQTDPDTDASNASNDRLGKVRDPRYRIALGVAIYAVLSILALLTLPAPLLNNWLPTGTSTDHARLLGTAAQIVLFTIGGGIALVGVGLSLSRHSEELKAAERDSQRLEDDRQREESRQAEVKQAREIDAERELRSRFVTAVDLLSSDQAIKRVAALYALAALADDWSSRLRWGDVQVCVDVVCGYLRAPLPGGALSTPVDEVPVRRTGYQIINAHLRRDAEHRWSHLRLDLSGALIDFRLVWQGLVLSENGQLLLDRATVSEDAVVFMRNITAHDGALLSFFETTIQGKLYVFNITARSGKISWSRVTVSGGGRIYFRWAELTDNSEVSLSGLMLQDNAGVSLDEISLADQSQLKLGQFRSTGTTSLSVDKLTIETEARVSIDRGKLHDESTLRLTGLSTETSGSVTLRGTSVDGNARIRLPGATISKSEPLALSGGTLTTGGVVILPDGRALNPPQK